MEKIDHQLEDKVIQNDNDIFKKSPVSLSKSFHLNIRFFFLRLSTKLVVKVLVAEQKLFCCYKSTEMSFLNTPWASAFQHFILAAEELESLEIIVFCTKRRFIREFYNPLGEKGNNIIHIGALSYFGLILLFLWIPGLNSFYPLEVIFILWNKSLFWSEIYNLSFIPTFPELMGNPDDKLEAFFTVNNLDSLYSDGSNIMHSIFHQVIPSPCSHGIRFQKKGLGGCAFSGMWYTS